MKVWDKHGLQSQKDSNNSETYLGSCQTPTIELFSDSS